MKPADPKLSLLSRLLAVVDATFAPYRFRGTESPRVAAAVAERRQRYLAGLGVPFLIGGSGPERYRAHSELSKCIAAGWLVSVGSGKGRCCSLTLEGEQHIAPLVARQVVGEAEPWTALEAVAAFTRDGTTNAGHVLEVDLVGIDYDHDDVRKLPLLVAGWLDSSSDSQGRIGYRLTPSGRDALAEGKPKLSKLPRVNNDLERVYARTLTTLVSDRDRWTGGGVFVPLSCGTWPEVGVTS
jgi:hypothetical protein